MRLPVALTAASALAAVSIAGVANGAASFPRSWTSMGPFALGTTRAGVYKQHGHGTAKAGAETTTYAIAAGVVSVSFVGNAVADLECGPTHLLEPCPQGFALPDGVTDNARVPRKNGWRGYTLQSGGTASAFVFLRTVKSDGLKIGVVVTVAHGRVSGIQLYRAT